MTNPPSKILVIIDGMHVGVDRTADPDTNRDNYSGKKKRMTYNTPILINNRGQILWISRTVPGSTHDLTLLKENPPDFGYLTKLMLDPNTPTEMRPMIMGDKGFIGAGNTFKGSIICTPIKKNSGSDPETGGLTQEELDYNRTLSGIRIKVENAIGEMKRYEILNKQYNGTTDQLNTEINIVTGLVNFKNDWERIKSENAPLIEQLTAWRRKT